MPVKETAQEIAEILLNAPGDWGLVVQSVEGGDTFATLNSDMTFRAASLAKIFVAEAILEGLDNGPLRFDTPLMIRERNRAAGAGWLQYFPEGFLLTLEQVTTLMLIDSDNTAMKMAVEHLGGVDAIRQLSTWIHQEPLLVEDGLLYSGLTTPEDVASSMQSMLRGSRAGWLNATLRQTNWPYGMQRHFHGEPRQYRYHQLRAKLTKLLLQRNSHYYANSVVARSLRRPMGPIASKEAALETNIEGVRDAWRHELGVFNVAGEQILVVAMCRSDTFGYRPNHPAIPMMARIGNKMRLA